MERKMVHVFQREPPDRIRLSYAERWELVIDIGNHDVELPVTAAVLNLHFRNAVRGHLSYLFLGLPSSRRFGSFSFPDRATGNAPRAAVVHRSGTLLKQVSGRSLLRYVAEK